MEKLSLEFTQITDNQSERFKALTSALQLPRGVDKTQVTRLLSFIDGIIDYYLQLDKQGKIRYPIIYIPCAEGWAEDVCIQYVYYKIESAFDSSRMQQLKIDLRRQIDATNRGLDETQQNIFIKEEKKWRKRIRPIIKNTETNENTRNLIVCGRSDYGRLPVERDFQRFGGTDSKTSITFFDVLGAEKKFRDYKRFENIFCFYSNNGDCDSYESTSIKNWEGLKNCFIFEFSSSPFCLKDSLVVGEKLCNKFTHLPLLNPAKRNVYPDFITINAEESHYLFQKEAQSSHLVINCPESILDEREYIIDLYKEEDGCGFSIKDRNILSLCLSKNTKYAYLDYLKKEKPLIFKDTLWESTLRTILEALPTQAIIDKILTFVNAPNFAFVIGDTPEEIKKTLKNLFHSNGKVIKFYHYRDLKEAKRKIKENRIVIMRFCPHNLFSYYPYKKPNSFDDYSLKDGQSVLDIINEIAIIDFAKYQYDYDWPLFEVTNSTFRRIHLGGPLTGPKRPDIPYVRHYSEQDEDADEQTQYSSASKVKFKFIDGTNSSYPESEVLIFQKKDNQRFLNSIRNIKELDELNQITALQPISELADETMDAFFNDEKNATSRLENTIREKYIKQGIIPTNHNTSVPIWKFILEKRVREYCIQQGLFTINQKEPVWQLVQRQLNDERIKNLHKQIGFRFSVETVLRDWCNVSSALPLAPGKKKDRENLIIDFLRLNRGISTMYHKKQVLEKNKTRTKNRITEDFLVKVLFNDVTDELANEILADSQYTENLAIETKEDIETLKKIAIDNINLKQVNTCTV